MKEKTKMPLEEENKIMNDPAARMKELRAEAIETVTSALWNETSTDEIAKAAFAGGLTPADVDKITIMVRGAKSKLDALKAYDVEALKADVESKKATFTKAENEAHKAIERREISAEIYDSANAELDRAKSAYEAAANAVQRGELPLDRAPKVLARIIVFREAAANAGQVESQIHNAKTQRRRLQPSLEMLEQRLKELDKTAKGKESFLGRPGGLIDERKAVRDQLKTLKQQISEIETMQAKAEADLPKAEAAAQEASAAIGY